jgi:hypothetical protein
MAERPGFMLYFDTTPALDRLSDLEAGKLFKALLLYAQFGEVSVLDGLAGFAFDLLRPRLDRDRQSYEDRCEKNRYTAYARETKRRGEEPMDFEGWKFSCRDKSSQVVTEGYQLNRAETEQNPTPTPTPASTPTQTSTPKTKSAGTGGAGGEPEPSFEERREEAIRMLENWGDSSG